MPVMEMIYDRNAKQFKSLLFPFIIFSTIMLTTFLLSFFINIPAFVLISFFSLAISLVSFLHDHWMLNSITIPIAVFMIPVAIGDLICGEFLYFTLHAVNSFFSISIITRRGTSLLVMILSTTMYIAWTFTILWWIGVPYPNPIMMGDPFISSTTTMTTGFALAIVVFLVNKKWKDNGGRIDCDGGRCPL